MMRVTLALLKRILVVVVCMRAIGFVADMAYLYHVLAFLGVAIAPVVSSQYFMPYLLGPSRFYSDLIGRGLASSATWSPPPAVLMFVVRHASMLVWLYLVSRTVCKLLARKTCANDNTSVTAFYARQLTFKAYGMYWLIQIPIVKAFVYLMLPISLPFHKYLIAGIPMAIVHLTFLVRRCLPSIYQTLCR